MEQKTVRDLLPQFPKGTRISAMNLYDEEEFFWCDYDGTTTPPEEILNCFVEYMHGEEYTDEFPCVVFATDPRPLTITLAKWLKNMRAGCAVEIRDKGEATGQVYQSKQDVPRQLLDRTLYRVDYDREIFMIELTP